MTVTKLEFTTPKRNREARPVSVDLCGHELVLHRPKDTTLYFASQISADTASDGDRAMAILQFVEGVLDPVTRKSFWDWAIAGDINLTAVMEMIGAALERWTDWDPSNTDAIQIDYTDGPWQPQPVEIVNQDLGIHWTCSPPSDLIVACVAASLATGADVGQQAWGIGIFLDAALSPADAMVTARRMRQIDDELELGDIAEIVNALLEQWRPPTNREQRRERAKRKPAAQQRPASARTTRATSTAKKPAAGKTAAKPR
jgi:hypothetical protein